jgi:glutamate synthase domain-containing protein 3
VEGVGDHGCEYMTGGRVVVLGKTGINFAAGMSGGIAYIYDTDGNFKNKYNTEMVQLENINKEDAGMIYNLIYNHYRFTKSVLARNILDNFKNMTTDFIKVMPVEYKRILEGQDIEKKFDSLEVSDG